MATGRSDSPIQVNNSLVFPGIWLGAMQCRTTEITDEMQMAAVSALAGMVSDAELHGDNILPKTSDERVPKVIADAIMATAREQGLAKN